MFKQLVKISLITWCSAISNIVYVQEHSLNFEQLTVLDGLTQNHITCIIQGRDGFMWFGTIAGLNKYDGKSITNYINDSHDPTSLNNNWVTSICYDKKSRVWLGTKNGGLNVLNPANDHFKALRPIINEPTSICSNNISTIIEDKDGNIWIGSDDYGISILFSTEKNYRFRNFDHNDKDKKSLSHSEVNTIYQSRDGTVWIGTKNGLNKVTKRNGDKIEFEYINKPVNGDYSKGMNITAIFEDSKGRIWVGTEKNGLNILTKNEGNWELVEWQNKFNQKGSYTNDKITSISEDFNGDLWIGTENRGLDILKVTENSYKLTNVQYDAHQKKSINNNIITTIYRSKAGLMWVGTWGGGINKLNWGKTEFQPIAHDPSDKNSFIKSSGVRAFVKDNDGNVWIGTHEGLSFYDIKKGRFRNYYTLTGRQEDSTKIAVYDIVVGKENRLWLGTNAGLIDFDPTLKNTEQFIHVEGARFSLKNNVIRDVLMDEQGNLWLATNEGLEKFIPERKEFIQYKHFPKNTSSIIDGGKYSLYLDRKGMIWIGGENGLSRYNRKENEFTNFTYDSLNTNSIGKGLVLSICEDEKGVIWIGTYGGGLTRFDTKKNQFKRFDKNNGLQDDVIYGILEDDNCNLWLSTNFGIIKFNALSYDVKNYNVRDGLQSNEFNGGAFYKSKDGEMFFGGVGGYNRFYPNNVKDNEYLPPVILTAFKVFGKKRLFDTHISHVKEIVIPYKENFFSFEFSSLDYLDPVKNQYAYKLEGFDEDWIYIGNRNFASYTNLRPGTYVFRVTGSNGDGVWNNIGFSVRLVITPPFWQMGWFVLLIIIAGIILIFVIYRFIILQLYNKRLQGEVEIQTSELNELNYELGRSNIELEKLSIVARETGNGVFITDADGNAEWINEGFSKLFGWEDLNDFIKHRGRNILEVSGHSKVAKIINDSVTNRKSVTYEGMNPTKDGRELWIQATLTPIFDEEGKLKRLVFVDTDITELKGAKDTAEQALKIQELFLANTSHEIRTPMNGVIGMTRQLIETPLNKEQTDLVHAILESSNNLLHVVNDILDVSKIRAGKIIFEKTPFRLEELFKTIEFIMHYKIQEKGIYLKTEIDPKIPSVLNGDPIRLNQILLNLVGNAIKFTNKGGVNISAKEISSRNLHSIIEFKITDTGIGIAEEQLDYIFESFSQAESHTTRKYGGTGLGLSIAKSLVEQQNGVIEVKSKLHKGSEFYFVLSFEHGDPNWSGHLEHQSEGIPKNVDLSELHILLVDDSKINQKVAVYEMKRWNANVDVADSAKFAFELLKKKKYNVILMDISMPEMDGIEATKYIREKIRARVNEVPIIAMTASALQGEKERCLKAGMNDYISKPFDPVNLYHKLIQWGKGGKEKYRAVLHDQPKRAERSIGRVTDLHFLEERSGGDPEYVKTMVRIYLEQYPIYLSAFNKANDENDWGGVRRQAHKMKGAVEYFGAIELHDILESIEVEEVKHSQKGRWEHAINEVNRLCLKSIDELNEYLIQI